MDFTYKKNNLFRVEGIVLGFVKRGCMRDYTEDGGQHIHNTEKQTGYQHRTLGFPLAWMGSAAKRIITCDNHIITRDRNYMSVLLKATRSVSDRRISRRACVCLFFEICVH